MIIFYTNKIFRYFNFLTMRKNFFMTGAIIFSRYPERLPGKALLDISGRCLLGESYR